MPEFGAENKSALFEDVLLTSAVLRVRRRKKKPCQPPGMHQSPLEALSEIVSPQRLSRVLCNDWYRNDHRSGKDHLPKIFLLGFSLRKSGVKLTYLNSSWNSLEFR